MGVHLACRAHVARGSGRYRNVNVIDHPVRIPDVKNRCPNLLIKRGTGTREAAFGFRARSLIGLMPRPWNVAITSFGVQSFFAFHGTVPSSSFSRAVQYFACLQRRAVEAALEGLMFQLPGWLCNDPRQKCRLRQKLSARPAGSSRFLSLNLMCSAGRLWQPEFRNHKMEGLQFSALPFPQIGSALTGW